MIAACYVRVSTAQQAEGTSLETQEELCRKRAMDLGAEEIWVYRDTYTGIELDRPEMRRLREAVASRAVQLIVVYDPDRFSRDLTDLLTVVREIDRAGIRLEFVNFDWEHTPQGLLFFQMRGVIAQFEHAQIKERTQRGKRQIAKHGRVRTFFRALGLKYNKQTKQIEVVPEEAELLNQCYRWLVEGDLTVYQIAQRLNNLGVAGPRGGLWTYRSLQRVLQRTYYRTGIVEREDEEPDWEPLSVPIIVPPELWDEAQGVLQRRRRVHRRHTEGQYLVQQMLRCGYCGRALVVDVKTLNHPSPTRKARKWTYYTCPGRYPRVQGIRGEPCPQKPVGTEGVDEAVWSYLVKIMDNPDKYLPSLQAGQEGGNEAEIQGALNEARRGLMRAERALARIEELYIEGDITKQRYRIMRDERLAELQRAQDQVAVLEGILTRKDDAKKTAAALKEHAKRLRRHLDDMPFDKRQNLVRSLVRSIKIRGEDLQITVIVDPASNVVPFSELVHKGTSFEKKAIRKLGATLDRNDPGGRRR